MKKVIIISIILFVILASGIIYLNQVILPSKIKSLIIATLAKQTGESVTLKSLEFNIFKGLVLRDLVISDSQRIILSTREANCTVFIWPIFRKQIIIPSLNFKSPYIFLERRLDNTFNLQELFKPTDLTTKEPFLKSTPSENKLAKKSEFSIFIHKINITSGSVVFEDNALAAKFKKEIKLNQLTLQLRLPAEIRFNFRVEIAANPVIEVSGSGQYKIINRELASNFTVKNLPPHEFQAYYNNLGLDFVSGLVDAQGKVNLENQQWHAQLAIQGNNLVLAKNKLKIKLNSKLESKLDYNLQAKKLTFNGNCDINQTNFSGLDSLGDVNNINGKLVFNENSLFGDALKVELLGMPLEINLNIKNFNLPVVNISTTLNLSFLPAIIKDKFNFSEISSANGKVDLIINLSPDELLGWQIYGSAVIKEAALRLEKQDKQVENIATTLEFSQQEINWTKTKFKYQGIDYQSNGRLSNFSMPNIALELSSQDLLANGVFDLVGKKFKITQLKGKYFDSVFFVSGYVDNSDPNASQLDLNGKINLTLEDVGKLLVKQYPVIKDIHPLGQMDIQFSLNGSSFDFKNAFIQAKLSSDNFSLYGLKTTDLSLDYLQEQGIAKITAMHIGFYDGVIDGAGALNLNTAELIYQLGLRGSGINLEKLKLDTLSKSKNISGIFSGEVKLNGAGSDLDKLDAAGSFTVSHGRLGELNLLQGLGKLLLAKDLGSIEFTGCTCAFLLKDKFVYTDKLKIMSSIVNLEGPIKIGFDSSLEGALDVEILSDMVPLSGTFKDVATAIIGKGGRFGVIKLSGTLREPKYAFKTAIGNIIQGLADVLFKK